MYVSCVPCRYLTVPAIDVESAILTMESILECAVVAKPDELWGEVPLAFVTLKANFSKSAVDPQNIIAHARRILAGYKVPREIRIVQELPKTSSNLFLSLKRRD